MIGASAIIECSTVIENGDWGIRVGEAASAEIRHCEVSYNGRSEPGPDGWSGIAVDNGDIVSETNGPYVIVEDNVCTNNTAEGISFWDYTSGIIQNNECASNARNGIYIYLRSVVTLGSNYCHDNGGEDIKDLRD